MVLGGGGGRKLAIQVCAAVQDAWCSDLFLRNRV